MKQVVIIDSNNKNQSAACRILNGTYSVYSFSSGIEGYKFIKSNSIDIAIADKNNNKLDGLKLIFELKKYNIKTPVIISVDELTDDIVSECFSAGAYDVMLKPFYGMLLKNTLKKCFTLNRYEQDFESVIIRKTEQMFQMQHRILTSFAKMIEYKDGMTGGHVIRTSAYVEIIANELKSNSPYNIFMNEHFLEDVIMSAPLHDIGKIGISDTIILKPATLTKEEFDIMRNHTICGSAIIEEALTDIEGESYLTVARDMALYHHEKWDGSGYPCGLSGTSIPLAARIMSVADVFDSLVSVRTYKDAYSYDKAFEIISSESSHHFDPVIVNAFLNRKQELINVGKEIGNGDIASFNRNSVIKEYLNKTQTI